MTKLAVCLCACVSLDLPNAFIQGVKFVISQAFLLEDGYDGVVDAARQNNKTKTHKLS